MDASLISTVDKALSSAEVSAEAEESGWTSYFEDFFASQKREEGSGNCSASGTGGGGGHDGYSTISDAASCAARTFPAATEAKESSKKLSFRKRKSRQVLDDDPLEDTASSPVNSPKVLREKGIGHENFTEVRRNDIDELGVNECTNLKKKGLCLVPLSMLVHHLV